ncbi:hypothetical protein [Clostridium cibarium]|uniref:Uncharacterized protein n=1 Tax=Clostridium cibarium TaxID=2762247 RepID=A0ABR8PXR8_9CLOT|nr:hypothetical protein [Clostridium cibarium]MBD7912948.1 hypothetical protein [Clostridium cibarium]
MNININERPNVHISDFEFLSLLKDKGESVYFKLLKETNKSTSIPINCKLTLDDECEYPLFQKLFKKYQNEGFGVFFTVNNGGSKQESIKSLSSHFIDMDFGKVPVIKDGKNIINFDNKPVFQYRTDEEIEHYKRTFLSKLNNFKLCPNIIIETKNGFHIYWLLDRSKPCDKTLFTPLQIELINYFGSLEIRKEHADLSSKTIERLLRIPNYLHLKDPDNPFLVKCIYLNTDIRYTQEDISNALNINISYLKTINNKKSKSDKKSTSMPITNISNLDIKLKNSITKIDFNDVFKYFRTEIDLRDFLTINCPINENFSCIFHDDKHPSAQISKASDGSYRYFCNSSNCNFSNNRGLDIIDIIKLQKNLSTSEALHYLCNLYEIKIIDYTWIQKETKKLENNYNLLVNYNEFKSMFPNIHKLLRYGYPVIFQLLFVARNSLQNTFLQSEGSSIFFISNRYLAKEIGKNLTRTNQYLNLLCVLGLINKINDKKIPHDMLHRAKEIAKKNGHNRISFYTIPDFLLVLSNAEAIATRLNENRFSINAMSKKYIENILGTDFANKIYLVPIKDLTVRQQIRDHLECIVINNIVEFGYTTKDMVVNEKILINNKYIDFSTRQYEFSRVIPDLLQKYDLVYVKANHKINSILGIDTKKYIIIKRDLLS